MEEHRRTTVAAAALVSFAEDQRQAHPHVSRDRGEAPCGVAIPEVRGPAADEPVDASDDCFYRQQLAWICGSSIPARTASGTTTNVVWRLGRWLANAQDDAGYFAPTSSPSEASVNVRSRHPVGRDEVDARQEVEDSRSGDIGAPVEAPVGQCRADGRGMTR